MNANDYAFRFGGIERLYGRSALEAFRQAHIAIVGLGGVGSWAAEALARSGIGTLTLIDMDDVCVSNTNRQLHALGGQYGKTKPMPWQSVYGHQSCRRYSHPVCVYDCR